VSVEMIEAVDWRDHPSYFSTCGRLLRPGGRLALQAITVPDSRYERAKTSSDFVKSYVFPGSCLPSVEAIERGLAAHTDLTVERVDAFPQDYAQTLAAWNERLAARADRARALGYDDALLRLWEFYLSYCEGAYAEEYVSLVQMTAVKQ
ncbi:MAG TPA: class I SAM-dependent methyltransferase, partial [Iamia sp.]|nr:class I SAM-dependent methyltransferase [Iamia sp.]